MNPHRFLIIFVTSVFTLMSSAAFAGAAYDACIEKTIGDECSVDGTSGTCEAVSNNCSGEPRAEGCVICELPSDPDNNGTTGTDAGYDSGTSDDAGDSAESEDDPNRVYSSCDSAREGQFCEAEGQLGQCGSNYNNCGFEGDTCSPCTTGIEGQCTDGDERCRLGDASGTCRQNQTACPDGQGPCWVCDVGEYTPSDAQLATDDSGCQITPLSSSPSLPGGAALLVIFAGASLLRRRRL